MAPIQGKKTKILSPFGTDLLNSTMLTQLLQQRHVTTPESNQHHLASASDSDNYPEVQLLGIQHTAMGNKRASSPKTSIAC